MVHTAMTDAGSTSSSGTERGEEENYSRRAKQGAKLFSLPDHTPAQFLLHNFDDQNLAGHIVEHGGLVTDDEAAADVILTRRRDEYKSMKDRYAISRKTHVRMSGFVDRCISSNRFVLAPVPGKGVPGRIPGARRTEFTEDDDEHLCQYIAEILPEKSEGGRTGHFIYTDLMRRVDQFGQYTWAQRHTKDAWRERYRKNQGRLDQRIAEIVEDNPPAPDGKGRYKSRRYGKLDLDEVDEEFMLDAEGGADSATDNEGGPVSVKKGCAQPQEEEEEEDGEEEQQPAGLRPDAELNSRDQDSYHEEEEEDQEAQPAGRQLKAGPTLRRKATRQKSHQTSPFKRRKAAASRKQEIPSPNDVDPTSPGSDGDDQVGTPPVDEDDFAMTEQPSLPAPSPETEPAVPETRRRMTKSRARPVAPLSPRRTRARSRLPTENLPERTPTLTHRRAASGAKTMTATPSSRRTRASARLHSTDPPGVAVRTTVAKAKPSAATLEAVRESEPQAAHDEFVAHSDEDESDMQEVEVNLDVDTGIRDGDQPAHSRARSLSTDDLQTSMRLQRAGRGLDEELDEEDEDEDSSDAELLAHVKKLDARPPHKASARQNLHESDESDESSAEEIPPPPATRVRAERSHLTRVAKVASYAPPPGTRAASTMAKGKGKARETALTRK